jgi:hypothetical protein
VRPCRLVSRLFGVAATFAGLSWMSSAVPRKKEKRPKRVMGTSTKRVSLPSLLSMFPRLAVFARAHLRTARCGAARIGGCAILYSEQRWVLRLARRPRASACRSPRSSVRTRDTSLPSGSCRFAVLPDLFKRQTGRNRSKFCLAAVTPSFPSSCVRRALACVHPHRSVLCYFLEWPSLTC